MSLYITWLLAALAACVACARADCDACVSGRCHSRRTLLEGFRVTDQLAVDRTDNILYIQLNDDLNTAIFLDEPKIRLVNILKTTGMTVDQNTQVLYTGVDGFIFGSKYGEDGYTTDIVYMLDETPAKLDYADVLYTTNTDGSAAYFSTTGQTAGKDNLEGFVVTDMVKVINTTTWVFLANGNLYKYVWTDNRWGSHLIRENKNLISTDKYGDIYVGETAEKAIYKLDRVTEELVVYATYDVGAVKDFVFEKDNNIVFLDEDGTVARWVPEDGQCTASYKVAPKPVIDFSFEDHLMISLLRGQIDEAMVYNSHAN